MVRREIAGIKYCISDFLRQIYSKAHNFKLSKWLNAILQITLSVINFQNYVPYLAFCCQTRGMSAFLSTVSTLHKHKEIEKKGKLNQHDTETRANPV